MLKSYIIPHLRTLARSWGGDLVEVTAETLAKTSDRWSAAPFLGSDQCAVNYKAKLVHYVKGVHWAHLVHEMAHVFACKYEPNHRNVDETDFLAWEWLVAKDLGRCKEWMKENRDYSLGDLIRNYDEIGQYKEDVQAFEEEVVALVYSRGVGCGNIVEGLAVSVRR